MDFPKKSKLVTIVLTGLILLTLTTTFFVIDGTFGPSRYSSARDGYPTDLLIVGLDARSKNDAGLPDSLTLYNLELSTFTAIPRSWEISRFGNREKLVRKYLGVWNCEPFCNIQGIYAYGNPDDGSQLEKDGRLEALRFVVEREYQIKSLGVVAFDLEWAESFLNNLGNIKINVEEPIPIGGIPLNGQLVEVTGYIPSGMQNLIPNESYWFARARFGSSNEDRMKRQLRLIRSILNQKTKADLLMAWRDAQGYSRTDLNGFESLSLIVR